MRKRGAYAALYWMRPLRGATAARGFVGAPSWPGPWPPTVKSKPWPFVSHLGHFSLHFAPLPTFAAATRKQQFAQIQMEHSYNRKRWYAVWKWTALLPICGSPHSDSSAPAPASRRT